MDYDSTCAILVVEAERTKRFQSTTDINVASYTLTRTTMQAAQLADESPPRAPRQSTTERGQ